MSRRPLGGIRAIRVIRVPLELRAYGNFAASVRKSGCVSAEIWPRSNGNSQLSIVK